MYINTCLFKTIKGELSGLELQKNILFLEVNTNNDFVARIRARSIVSVFHFLSFLFFQQKTERI
jgi:hypothetical protein